MTPANVQLLFAFAAAAGAAGVVVWILHSRTAAKKRAREKAVEDARHRAQVRARVANEANRRRIEGDEREIALARLAARRAELAKRREELLTPGVADQRVEPSAVQAVPEPKPPGWSQHRAQADEERLPVVPTEGSPADMSPVLQDASPDAATTDTGNAIEVTASGTLESKVVVADTAPPERPLSSRTEPAIVSEPLDATGAPADLAAGAPLDAAPPIEPVAPDPHPPLEVGTPPVHAAPDQITRQLPVLETANECVAAPADSGQVPCTPEPPGEVGPTGALSKEPCSPDHSSSAAEHLPACAAEVAAVGWGEKVAANATSKDGERDVPTENFDTSGVGPALHGAPSNLESGIGDLGDFVPAVRTTPPAIDAEPRASSALPVEPQATHERRIDQALGEEALPSDVPSVTPVIVGVKDLAEAQAPTEAAQGDEWDPAIETGTHWEPSIAAAKQQRQYQPVVRDPAKVRPPPPREAAGSRDRGCAVDVRVQFAKGGFCRVALLPHRADGMPPNLSVSGPGGPVDLSEMQEDLYEDVFIPGLGDLLAQGVAWESITSGGQRYSWALGGREVYVLSAQPHLSGYLNTQRLMLNERHVVLCLATRKDEVLAAIAATGSPIPDLLGCDSGVPEKWIALRDVVPRLPVQASHEGDILDCLRPLPKAQLSLEGGIRIEGNSWLAGFPPRIRVRGDQASVTSLFIDGHGATADATGGFIANGWDAIGEHVVSASVGTRTYTIEGEREDWQSWTAHAWSLGEEAGVDEFQRPSICGALVQAPRSAAAAGRAIVVPASNTILIGEVPGEIEICRPHGDTLNKLCVGFPNFEPVWAIPATALRCDKRIARVILLRTGPNSIVQKSPAKAEHRPGPGRRHDHSQRAWSSAILAAARKGLVVNPHDQFVVDLWKVYRERARALARSKA